MLHTLQIPVGPFQANAWLAWAASPGPAILVDAGAEAGRLLETLAERELTLEAILQTHAHADHIEALPAVVEATGAPVYLHADAEPMLHDAGENLSAWAGFPIVAPVPYTPVADGERLTVLGRDVLVLHTPGHAAGSVSYWFSEDEVVFTGDALFQGSIGRTDFPGGSHETLIAGIRDKLLTLPDSTRVLAGHMGPTTVGRERRENPFLA